MWHIDPFLRNHSVNSGRYYLTPATYTQATIEELCFYVVHAATITIQRHGKHTSTTKRGCVFCVVCAEELF
jgi:hypothetical protein